MLVVDDHALLRSVIVQVLADDGLDALEAGPGDAGVRMAEQQQPDVILLDVAMPGPPAPRCRLPDRHGVYDTLAWPARDGTTTP